MKFFPIFPISALDDIGYIFKEHFLLAHIKSEKYWTYYRLLKNSRVGYYIILDNGAYEKKSVSPEELMYKAYLVGANEVIVPDKLSDKQETLKLIETFTNLINKTNNIRYMFVPQGKTLEEWKECFDEIVRKYEKLIDVIGIPKVLGEYRRDAIKYVKRNSNFPIHALGCNSFEEMVAFSKLGIRSMDSKLPVKLVLGTDNCSLEEDVDANCLKYYIYYIKSRVER